MNEVWQLNEVWSPVELEVLLRCYYSAEERNGIKLTQASAAALQRLSALGLITPSEAQPAELGIFTVTKRGLALVLMLLATPAPVEGWFDPRSGEKVVPK